MRAVLQRVSQAKVTVNQKTIGQIGIGWLVFVGIEPNDDEKDCHYLANKIVFLRGFSDGAGKFNHCLSDVQGQVLLVSQFTLLADCRKGRRPGFSQAALPSKAEQLYLSLGNLINKSGIHVEYGQFGSAMEVNLTNDGPVTLLLDSHGCF
jgi:D-tyrosyl-tRNA(Tyr) deacylase